MLPRLILTSGEPAGIGPDLCVAAAARPWPCELVIAGDADVLAERAKQLGSRVAIARYRREAPRSLHVPGTLNVLHSKAAASVVPGLLSTANASFVLGLLDAAVEGCTKGEFDAIVTAPVQKSVIQDAGIPFSGHTEYLAHKTGSACPVMLLACGNLRVALATTHLPLRAVADAITPERLRQVLSTLDADLRKRFKLARPRILVCALNPHAGESGHMGREEIDVIAPTLEHLRAEGLNVIGPAPADTAFTPHMLSEADAVLAMYHDQGLPVIKYAAFDKAVNITLGLPILRTSVDHGTALNLAGSGKADASSLFAAIGTAIELCSSESGAP